MLVDHMIDNSIDILVVEVANWYNYYDKTIKKFPAFERYLNKKFKISKSWGIYMIWERITSATEADLTEKVSIKLDRLKVEVVKP